MTTQGGRGESHTRQILQRLVDAGGVADKEGLQLVTHPQCQALSTLKAFGYVVTEHRITDEGRAHLDRLKQRTLPSRRARKDAAITAAWSRSAVIETRHPLATTEEQIAAIRRQAEQGREQVMLIQDATNQSRV